MEKLNEVRDYLKRVPEDSECILPLTYQEASDFADNFQLLDIENRRLSGMLEMLRSDYKDLEQREAAAESKLAELEKQEPLGFMHKMVWNEFEEAVCTGGENGRQMFEGLSNHFPVYARPAPAVSLVELVPPEADGSNLPFAANGWNACRAAMLANLEKSK